MIREAAVWFSLRACGFGTFFEAMSCWISGLVAGYWVSEGAC